jgi:hypothetical protein
VFVATEDFSKVEVFPIGEHNPEHGFSSFKFIPHRHNEIVALKSVETETVIETCTRDDCLYSHSDIMVFDILSKEVLLEETLIGKHKCVAAFKGTNLKGTKE